MKKILLTMLGGSLVLVGLVFIIIPGPALLLIIPGLILLSFEYPMARRSLSRCQKLMQKSAQWIDAKLLHRKYSR